MMSEQPYLPFPTGQLSLKFFFQGELIGGADIVTQMHESGELKKMIASSSE
jgi:glutaredoxin-related protein